MYGCSDACTLMCWLSIDGEPFVDDQEYYYEQDQQETFDQDKYNLGPPWLPILDTQNFMCMCPCHPFEDFLAIDYRIPYTFGIYAFG
jgi:hypothetical protein